MASPAFPSLAYFLPSGQEMIILLVVGVLLFGRRLPEVGRQIGRAVTELRRGLDRFKREMANDDTLRGARSGLKDLKRAVDAPRRIADPKRLFEELTDESRSTSAPEKVDGPTAQSGEIGS